MIAVPLVPIAEPSEFQRFSAEKKGPAEELGLPACQEFAVIQTKGRKENYCRS